MLKTQLDVNSDEYVDWIEDKLKGLETLPPEQQRYMTTDVPKCDHGAWVNETGTIVIVAYAYTEPEEGTSMDMWGYLLKDGQIVKEFKEVPSPGEDYLSGVPYSDEFRELYDHISQYDQAGGDELATSVLDV